MICRRCGNRIPENLTTREYFECPSCGRKFGTPPQERRPQTREEYAPPRQTPARRNAYDAPRRSAYDDRSAYDAPRQAARAAYQPQRARSRFEPEYDDRDYDNRRYDDRYYDDDPYYEDDYQSDQEYYGDDAYYDDDPYSDGGDQDESYYDEDYPEDDYIEDAYEDAYLVDEDDLSDLRRPPRTMKLTSVLLGMLIAAIATVIIMYCVAAGLGWNEEVAVASALKGAMLV